MNKGGCHRKLPPSSQPQADLSLARRPSVGVGQGAGGRPRLREYSHPACRLCCLEEKLSSPPIPLFSVWERTQSERGGRELGVSVSMGCGTQRTVRSLSNATPHEEFPEGFPRDTLG